MATPEARRPSLLVPAILIALGLAVAGGGVSKGLRQLRTADRYVTVKGMAERDVDANVALWPLRYTTASDDLTEAQRTIESNREAILAFLADNGIGAEGVDVQSLQVTDVHANPYRSGPVQNRYIIEQSLMVRTDDPDRVQKASQRVGDLVAVGVVLGGQHGPPSTPTYLFTQLSEHKPEMLAEATANARVAAEQFAADSGSRVGGIRHANQGVFQILARDPAPGVAANAQRYKTIRVVTTIQYFLEE